MIQREGVEVADRFYKAIDFLIENKAIRGRQTFCHRYDIDRRHFHLICKHPETHSMKVAWLTYLTRDYKISANWLLTGRGKMSKTENVKNLTLTFKRKAEIMP